MSILNSFSDDDRDACLPSIDFMMECSNILREKRCFGVRENYSKARQ